MSTQQTAREFAKEFSGMAESFGDDQADALRECTGVVRAGIAENFQQSRSSSGQSWPARKDPAAGNHPLLIKDGKLLAAATGKGAGSVARVVDQQTLEVGVDPDAGTAGSVKGARRHQYGDTPPGILARPFIGVSDSAADKCAEVVADHALREIG